MKSTILRALKKSAAAVVAMAVLCAAYLSICTNQVNADGYNQGIVTFVTSLYADCLGRNPDPVGLNDWCAKLASGQITGKQCAYGFFFSPEFQAKANNMSDDAFIEAYYRVFLNRTSDPNGKAYWAGKIANTTNDISILFTGFADSIEFSNKCASYGITAGPHINVPTTVRGASGGGSGGGGAANASLQSAAESALATYQSVAASHGYALEESTVIRNTSTQYGIYYRFRSSNGWFDGVIKAELRNGSIAVFDSPTPFGTIEITRDYDAYTNYFPWNNCEGNNWT